MLEAPKLEFALEVTLRLRPRLRIDPLPVGGARLSVPVLEGEFEGPLLKGKVLSGGGEFPHVRTDDVFSFDARYHLQEEDGTIIYIQNRGYRHGSPEVMERLWKLQPGDHVDPSEYYFRSSTLFETAPGKHDWLAKNVFVGVGGRLEKGNVLRYYRVV